MNRSLASAALVALLAVPGAAAAQEVGVFAGVTLTTDYISRGLTNSNRRPAVQPYLEAEVNGFYLGAWASNVRFPGDPDFDRDRVEYNLYAGFRNSLNGFSYDIGYARYFYNRSGDLGGELLLSLGYEAPYGMTFGTSFAFDPDAEVLTSSISAAYAFNDMFSVSAEAGRVQASHNFYNVGVGFAFNEFTSLDVRVHDTNITSPRLVASLAFDFSLR